MKLPPFLLIAAATLAWSLHAADLTTSTEELVGFDKRRERRAAPTVEQTQARETLRQQVRDAKVDFDPQLGSPKWVRADREQLTAAQGEGKGVTPKTAQRFRTDPNKAVKSFVEDHRALFGHGPEDLDSAVKTRDYVGEKNGVRTTVWHQHIDSIPVYESIFAAHVNSRGELMDVSSQFVPQANAAANRGTPNRAAHVKSPKQSIRKAMEIAAKAIGEPAEEFTTITAKPEGAEQVQSFKIKPLPGEATARLVWFPLDRDTLRLAWQVELNRRQFSERFRVLVDVQDGEVLLWRKLTVDIGAVTYRVFTNDSPTPMRPGWPAPNATQPPLVSATLVTLAAVNTNASPLGWINDGEMILRGNNIDASLDRDADNRPDLPRVPASVDATGHRTFDYPLNAAQHPTNYSAGAVVQLFYWCNWIHDRLYEIGFTEAKGNYQKDNFGRGGAGNDPVIAEAQDGSGVNNANFTPAPDGSRGRIQMYLFSGPNPQHDGDLDAEVILHEYTHGMSDRRVGHGTGISQLQTYGLGEGWSDFFAEAMLTRYEHDLDANYPMGGYASYLLGGLQESYYYGIRRYPYSTSTNVSPLMFQDIDPAQASTYPQIPRNPTANGAANEVHRLGEVWCEMLWEMRAALLRSMNLTPETYQAANDFVMRIVADGMDFTPPNPTFTQARDGILTAERALTGGTNAQIIWTAFAKRGLGFSAVALDTTTTAGIQAAYDVPAVPAFSASPQVLTFSGITGGHVTPSSADFTLINQSDVTLSWAAIASAPLTISPTNGTLLPHAAIPVTVFTNGMSALPVGDHNITVAFTNFPNALGTTRTVLVSVKPPGDALSVVPTGTFLITGPPGGPFTPSSQIYTLQAAAPLIWSVSNAPSWMTFSKTNGSLAAGEFVNVTASINANATLLPGGVFSSNIYFINKSTGSNVSCIVTLRIGSEDHLTEDFASRPFDLQHSVLTLRPAGTSYLGCFAPAANFAVDPAEGTAIIGIDDDEYRQITLTGGKTISFFGQSTNVLWIGANGNVTPNPGVSTNFFFPGTFEYFNVVRVAPLYLDLDARQNGRISWQQLSNRLAVTYENVPEFGKTNVNSFQVELFFDGVIRITWLTVESAGGLAGVSPGGGIPADYESSDLSALAVCTPSGRLVIPSLAREGDGVLQGTILLSLPGSNAMDVVLSLDNTNEVIVPSVVTIPAGNFSATFPITIVDDALLDGTQTANLLATFPDRPSATASISVNDNEATRITVAVPAETTEGGGVLSGEGFILLGAPAGRDVTVQLTSSNSMRVLVPASVVVPAGSRTAFFDLTTVDDNLLNGLTEDVTIAASVTGWPYDKDIITVHDNDPYLLSLTLIPETAENGGSVLDGGTVTLPAVATVPVLIMLSSDQPATLFTPLSVTIAPGMSATNFSLFIVDNSNTNSFDAVKIVASSPGFISATGSVIVLDDERPTAPFGPFPANGATLVRADTAFRWTVNPLPQPGAILFDVYLSTNPNPTTLVGTTTNLILGAGTQLDSGQTYYWKVVARRDPFQKSSAVWSFTTAPFDHFSIASVASPQTVGQPFQVNITARDEYEKIVFKYIGTATLTNFLPSKPKSKIVITEVDSGDSDRMEFQNVSSQDVNIAGWRVTLYDAISWPTPKITYTVPTPSVCKPGQLFWLRAFAARFAPGTYPNFVVGTNLSWNSLTANNPIAVLLRDNVGNIVDFFCAVDAFPAQITAPLSISPGGWMGVPVLANAASGLTYQRQGNIDNDNAGDWAFLPGGILATNPGILVPFTNYAYAGMIVSSLTNFVSGVCTGLVTVLDEAKQMYLGVTDGFGHNGIGTRFDVLAFNDISVGATAPDNVTVNDAFVVSIVVTNRGSSAATGLVLSNRMAAAAEFVSSATSQGACSLDAGAVVCDLGQLPGGGAATIALTIRAISPFAVTNIVAIRRGEPDNYLLNNIATTITIAGLPQLLIADATVSEPLGNSPATMIFNVRLTPSNSAPVSVQFSTADGTATAGSDYVAMNGLLVFSPGTTNQTISVAILPDSLSESNETFLVNLFSPVNGQILDDQGFGTINDNDLNPVLDIVDIITSEGNDGTNNVTFFVTLSAVSGKLITVAYSTTDASAIEGLDYLPAYGVLTFPPGVTNASITVGVLGNNFFKADRKFYILLSSPSQVTLSRPQALCTIIDDDTNLVHQLAFDAVPSKVYVDVPFTLIGTARDVGGQIATNFNGPVHLLATENETFYTVGSNSSPFEFPLGSSYHDSRLQVIYWATELGLAGEITSLSLDVTNVPGLGLSNFTIRTKPFVPAQFPTATWEAAGWTTNFQSDVAITSKGWVTFAFRAPYIFDGVTNVLVDISFNNSSYGTEGICRSTVVPALRAIGFRTDGAFGDPLAWSNAVPSPSLFNRIPNTRFTIGRTIPVTPPTIEHAANGVFTTALTLSADGTNVTLRAVDDEGHFGVYSGFTVVLDGDGDGMADWWEIANGFDRNNPTDGVLDGDADGLTNFQEFLAGTNPHDGASSVRIVNTVRTTNSVLISVQAIAGKRYQLESTTNLPPSWTAVTSPVAGTGTLLNLVHVPPVGDRTRFYRVRVLP